MGISFPDVESFAEEQKKSDFMHTWENQGSLLDVMVSISYSKCKNEKYKATLTEDVSIPYLGRNAICMYINVYYMEI